MSSLPDEDDELCLPPFRRLIGRLPGLARVGLYDDPFEEYLHQQTRDITWDLDVIIDLVERCAGPVLDIGCGRGRIALAVAALGAPVRAVDSSSAVITRLRAALARDETAGTRVTAVHGNALDVATDLGADNRLAVIGDVSINMFAHPEHVACLLERVRASLAPNGVLVLPVLTASGVARYTNRNGVLADEFTDIAGRQHVVFGSMRFDAAGPSFSRTLFSQQGSPRSGSVRAHLACVRERLWTWQTLGPLATAAGLTLTDRRAVNTSGPPTEVLLLTPTTRSRQNLPIGHPVRPI